MAAAQQRDDVKSRADQAASRARNAEQDTARVREDAARDQAELRAAFRESVLRHHPDRSADDALATRRRRDRTPASAHGRHAPGAAPDLLLADIPEHPMRRRLLHGFGFVLSLRADYAEALAVAERAEALSSATSDPVLVLVTCMVHGYVDQLQGRSRAAGAYDPG